MLRKVIFLLQLGIDFALSVPLYLARVRILQITAPGRIGHLASEPDVFVKLGRLGLRGAYRGVIFSPPGTAANERLLGYWSRYLWVVRTPFWLWVMGRFRRFPYMIFNISSYMAPMGETSPYIAVYKAWGARPPLLRLDEEHRRRGRAWLAEQGVPASADIVCFHCREGGYSPADEEVHSYRNCSVENYLPAVAELTRRGYWCVRMGDPTMRRFEPMEKVIDYAHLESRCDWLDVFLCAESRFFLGASSGLLYVSTLFGRPVGAANQAPFSTVLAFSAIDVAIPKLMWSEREQRLLTFREIFDSDVSNLRYTKLFGERGIRTVENSGDEVCDLALEMLDRVNGTAAYEAKDEELQQRFLAMMRPGHYGYGGVNRVGRDFLRKYEPLFGDVPDKR
jgi:putative glycosyltransferase (TIGR04372 family)